MASKPRLFTRAVQAWRRLEPLLGSRRWWLLALGGISLVAGVAEAAMLAIVAQVATAMATGETTATVELGFASITESLTTLLFAALVSSGVRLVAQLVATYIPARLSADILSELRHELFGAFTEASWGMQSSEREGRLQQLITSHVPQAASAVQIGGLAIAAAATLATLVGAAFVLSPILAAVIVVTGLALSGVLYPLGRMAQAHSQQLSELSTSFSEAVSEATRMAEEMQVYGTASAHRDRLGRYVEAMRHPFFMTRMLVSAVPATYQALALVLVIGGLLALTAFPAISLGQLGAIVLILVRAFSYGQALQGTIAHANELTPYVSGVQRQIDAYRSSRTPTGDRVLTEVNSLAFQDVGFSYKPERPALQRVSFEVKGGATVGIVGPSGSGKSTLIQLLLRLRFPDTGGVLINGVDIEDFSRSSWHRIVAYVPQEPRLLDATVRDNIRYLRDLSESDIQGAATLAGIHDEILRWPQGYDQMIGQQVDAISGGQRQRLSLARALAARPKILVLDEPTSALDLQSELRVQESLEGLREEVTVFIIAHRMSTLSICDQLIVLRNGSVEAFGTPAVVTASSSFYRQALRLTRGDGGLQSQEQVPNGPQANRDQE